MADLYRRHGSAPDVLPSKVFNESGAAYTAPYAPADLALLGLVLAPEKPGDTETQTAEWNAETEAWVMVDRPPLPPQPAPTADDVDAERDHRIDGGFSFSGHRYQSRPKDRENILGAASLAHMALTLQGKQPGDLHWHGLDSDFVWIAEDNSLVPMDALAVIGFGNAAAMHKSNHTFAARAIKNMDPIPADFAEDSYWPAP